MVGPQGRWVRTSQSTIDDQGPWHSPVVDGVGKGDFRLGAVDHNLCQAGPDHQEGKDGRGAHKCKEIAIVPAAHAVIEPNTVVIERLDTVVADATVITPRRSPDVTGLAVFHRHVHGGDI